MSSEPSSSTPGFLAGRPPWVRAVARVAAWTAGIAFAGMAAIATVGCVALAVRYPNLPNISELSDYTPKLPLRVYSAEGVLIGEFGERRSNLTPIGQIPKVM